jgi:hypothetical protein
VHPIDADSARARATTTTAMVFRSKAVTEESHVMVDGRYAGSARDPAHRFRSRRGGVQVVPGEYVRASRPAYGCSMLDGQARPQVVDEQAQPQEIDVQAHSSEVAHMYKLMELAC